MRYWGTLAALVCALLCTGCSGATEPVIEGESYRTGFYPEWLWVGDVVKAEEPVRCGRDEYYRVEAEDIALYQSYRNSRKSGGELYCRADQWDDANEFYNDGANYIFQMGHRWAADVEFDATLEDIEFDKFDMLAKGEYDIADLNWYKEYADNPDTLALAEAQLADGTACSLKAYTVDGRFVSASIRLFRYNGELYYWLGVDVPTGLYYFIPVETEISDHFCEKI